MESLWWGDKHVCLVCSFSLDFVTPMAHYHEAQHLSQGPTQHSLDGRGTSEPDSNQMARERWKVHLGLLPPLPWLWVWLLDATQAVNGRSSWPLMHSVICSGKHLFPFTSLLCVNDTEEQTDEIFKAKSGKVPSTSTGASVAMEMGCAPFPGCKYPQPRSSPNFILLGFLWRFHHIGMNSIPSPSPFSAEQRVRLKISNF